MAIAVRQDQLLEKPPVGELGADVYGILPGWDFFGGGLRGSTVDREEVSELRWPNSIRVFTRMRNDTQLSGLYRGTTLPIRRYVWGIDANGADPAIVDAVCRDFNLQTIDKAWQAFETGQSEPTPRARNAFLWDRHHGNAQRALYYGHYYFELHGDIGGDGKWHPEDASPRSPWTIQFIWVAPNGDLIGIKQNVANIARSSGAILDFPELDANRLVPYVFDQEPGDWTGRSMFRSCYREWLLKDQLLRVDVINHRRAGGVLINEAPPDATPAQVQALSQLAQQLQVGGGGSVPNGTTPVFIRGSGSDVIASINRHDESMAREFLMMFMALGTSSSGGNRALGQSFIDWFAVSQESIAIWVRDVFQQQAIDRYIAWNYGDQDYVPMLAFKRPEEANPLDRLAAAVAANAGTPGALGVALPEDAIDPAAAIPVAATRFGGDPGALVVDDELRHTILAAHADYEQWARPRRTTRPPTRAAAPAELPLPDRKLRRQPYQHEVAASVNFEQVDQNWQSHTDQLVAEWKTIRADQIAELARQIAGTSDLAALAKIDATPAGAALIAAKLRQMAQVGAGEAVAEAARQGVPAPATPAASVFEAELVSRADALEQLLASALSQAAANRAVQLSGGGLQQSEVATQVAQYLNGLSDAYLTDQFGGAVSAAQNAGRLAAMGENNATRLYASELLDVNTCEPCTDIDGTEYATADEAAQDYPAGGYRECDGGPRCRGTIVAVYGDESPASVGLSRLEKQVGELRAAVERPVEVHVHDARTVEVPVVANIHMPEEKPLQLSFAEGAIHTDVHVTAPPAPRPRTARARRGEDGSLEVTYDEGDA